MDDDLVGNEAQRDLDTEIQATNLTEFAQEALGDSEQTTGSMFDNRFFNQFVNSPNFTKRL